MILYGAMNRWRIAGLMIILQLISAGLQAHPVHVSVLNIEYNASRKTLDFTFRFYKDDMELAIFHNYAIQVKLDSVGAPAKTEQLVNRYMNERFHINLNGKALDSLQYSRKVNDGPEIWLYYSIPVQGELKTLKVTNQLMMDLYFDQTNLVICGPKGKETAYELNYDKNEFTQDFSDK